MAFEKLRESHGCICEKPPHEVTRKEPVRGAQKGPLRSPNRAVEGSRTAPSGARTEPQSRPKSTRKWTPRNLSKRGAGTHQFFCSGVTNSKVFLIGDRPGTGAPGAHFGAQFWGPWCICLNVYIIYKIYKRFHQARAAAWRWMT